MLTTILLILSALIWLPILFYQITNRGLYPLVLALLWPLVLIRTLAFPTDELLLISGIFFLPMDPVYFSTLVYLILSAVIRREKFIRALQENPFLSLLILIVVAYIILYMPLYGKSAIGEARKTYFIFLFPLLAAITIEEFRDLRRLMRVVVLVAGCIAITGLGRLIMGVHVDHLVNAEGALLLLFVVFSILIFHSHDLIITNRSLDVVMLIVFLALVIVTQHRTVYLGGAAGVLFLFVLQRDHILFLAKSTMALMLIVGLMGAVFISSPKFERQMTGALGGIVDPYADTTASWRIKRWEEQIGRVVAANQLLLGEGLGGYYQPGETGAKLQESLHNGYFEIVLHFGLFGLAVYLLFVFMFFRKTMKVRKELPNGLLRACVEAGIVNFGAALAYSVGYGFPLIMLIFYALAMSAVRLQAQSWRVLRTT